MENRWVVTDFKGGCAIFSPCNQYMITLAQFEKRAKEHAAYYPDNATFTSFKQGDKILMTYEHDK